MMNEPLSTIMSTKLVTVNKYATLDKVKEVLDTKRYHHVPIVDGTKLVGIITTHDLYRLNKPFSEYPNINVTDVMTDHIATLEPTDKVGAACQVFLENKFHAVPIVQDGELVGLVTSFDLLRYEFKKEYKDADLWLKK